MASDLFIDIPEFHIRIRPGYKVKLGRFDSGTWKVLHGWYSWGGNRATCGWYLVDVEQPTRIKPLQETDLADIYLVET